MGLGFTSRQGSRTTRCSQVQIDATWNGQTRERKHLFHRNWNGCSSALGDPDKTRMYDAVNAPRKIPREDANPTVVCSQQRKEKGTTILPPQCTTSMTKMIDMPSSRMSPLHRHTILFFAAYATAIKPLKQGDRADEP